MLCDPGSLKLGRALTWSVCASRLVGSSWPQGVASNSAVPRAFRLWTSRVHSTSLGHICKVAHVVCWASVCLTAPFTACDAALFSSASRRTQLPIMLLNVPGLGGPVRAAVPAPSPSGWQKAACRATALLQTFTPCTPAQEPPWLPGPHAWSRDQLNGSHSQVRYAAGACLGV